jgi:hypothetical protein
MMQYLINLRLWWVGFRRLGELTYLPGWTPLRFFPVYLLNHGTRVLTGGACSSWSRWFYENRDKLRFAKFMDRLLNKFDTHHGAESGEVMWGTVSLPYWQQAVLSACYAWGFYLWLF